MRRLTTLACVFAALASPAAAVAQDCPQTTLGDIEDEVMCPICGTPLALATEAPQAQRERAFIERQIAACRSKPQIKQALVAQFGESVLALPGDEGGDDLGDVLVYVVPGVGILLALCGVGFAVVRWRERESRGPRSAALPAADPSKLEADMDRYEL